MPRYSKVVHAALALVPNFKTCLNALTVRLAADVFSIVPLSLNEWLLVLLYAFPVILIDEVLKFIGRNFVNVSTTRLDGKAKEA